MFVDCMCGLRLLLSAKALERWDTALLRTRTSVHPAYRTGPVSPRQKPRADWPTLLASVAARGEQRGEDRRRVTRPPARHHPPHRSGPTRAGQAPQVPQVLAGGAMSRWAVRSLRRSRLSAGERQDSLRSLLACLITH